MKDEGWRMESELVITSVRLPSMQDLRDAQRNLIALPASKDWIWCMDPSNTYEWLGNVAYLSDRGGNTGKIFYMSEVDTNVHLIRPAADIENAYESGLSAGSRFNLAGHSWTMLNDRTALCDDDIGAIQFRQCNINFATHTVTDPMGNQIEWDNINKWEHSDVKDIVDKWAARAGIMVQQTQEVQLDAGEASL